MNYPEIRMRRLRHHPGMRRLVSETAVRTDDLIYPLFVCPGENIQQEISAMPGQYRWSVDRISQICREVVELGIPAVLLFGIPESKDELGSASFSDTGIIQQAIRQIKQTVPDLMVIADVCLCEYTSHGHCGVLENGVVQNDPTLKLLQKQAVSFARAGVDMVAPSDMMDGRVSAIRNALDAEQFQNVPIMAYSAKYQSAFYGPFREAANSAPGEGDRSGYQMAISNADEALREVALDIQEGADIVMVKPAMAYLDIIYRVTSQFNVPVAAYQVSGEYACIKAAAKNGWIDETNAMNESLIAIKRAGADIIITYFACDMARYLSPYRYP